jgi:peptidoglycan/LPS O-acetylase OafA/YrhL
VISGYCVTACADALRWRHGPAQHFFWRRFRRIYPPYWVAFALTALCACLVEAFLSSGYFHALIIPHPKELTKWQWLGNLSLTETWRWHLTGGTESVLLPPSWTLCYEEQFYFLVGIALVLTRRFFFVALVFLTLIVAIQFLFPCPGLYTEGLFLDGQWLMFASGILVYYVSNYVVMRRWVWCCLPLVIGILNALSDPRQLRQPLNQNYLAAFSFALVIMGLKRWDDYARTCRILSPIRSCGDMCYSLYLVHWPVVQLVGHALDSLGANTSITILLLRIPFCVATTILVGTIFHRLIERKFWNPGMLNPTANPPG